MEMVVFDYVCEDIFENKRLNVYLFNVLKKGLYKLVGFFKGFFWLLVVLGVIFVEVCVVSGVFICVLIFVIYLVMVFKELCDFVVEMVLLKNEFVSVVNYLIKVFFDKW